MFEILFKLINQLDFLFKEYNRAKKIINRIKPSCVIFQSATPFYSPNITFRKVCIDYTLHSQCKRMQVNIIFEMPP